MDTKRTHGARRPPHPCAHLGCSALIDAAGVRYCAAHQRARDRRAHEPPRPTAHQRGYNNRWRIESRAYLAEHPLCVYCARRGVVTLADCVDHIRAHRGDPRLFWDRANWASACRACNSAKAAREEGGYGNAPRR
jgi:5-methylcytosine-specific restriction protein A